MGDPKQSAAGPGLRSWARAGGRAMERRGGSPSARSPRTLPSAGTSAQALAQGGAPPSGRGSLRPGTEASLLWGLADRFTDARVPRGHACRVGEGDACRRHRGLSGQAPRTLVLMPPESWLGWRPEKPGEGRLGRERGWDTSSSLELSLPASVLGRGPSGQARVECPEERGPLCEGGPGEEAEAVGSGCAELGTRVFREGMVVFALLTQNGRARHLRRRKGRVSGHPATGFPQSACGRFLGQGRRWWEWEGRGEGPYENPGLARGPEGGATGWARSVSLGMCWWDESTLLEGAHTPSILL